LSENCVRKKRIEKAFKETFVFEIEVARWMTVHFAVCSTGVEKSVLPGFESRQGVRILGLYTLQGCCQNLISIVIVIRFF
jgi:hypothetical protein